MDCGRPFQNFQNQFQNIGSAKSKIRFRFMSVTTHTLLGIVASHVLLQHLCFQKHFPCSCGRGFQCVFVTKFPSQIINLEKQGLEQKIL